VAARHRHPARRRPVALQSFLADLQHGITRAGIARCRVSFPKKLTALHRRNPRRYAQVLPGRVPRFEFAAQVLALPREHQLGLIAHEIGHVLAAQRDPQHSEQDADRAAHAALGARIAYDRRWPGKGLQRLVNGLSGLASVKDYIDRTNRQLDDDDALNLAQVQDLVGIVVEAGQPMQSSSPDGRARVTVVPEGDRVFVEFTIEEQRVSRRVGAIYLDREQVLELLLPSGEIDWRPQESIPEDYYANPAVRYFAERGPPTAEGSLWSTRTAPT